MAVGEYIIIAREPDNYTSLSIRVFGPCGKLDNDGEKLELQIPGDMEYSKDRYRIPVEVINYVNTASWPIAEEYGKSLQRINAEINGNDYSNWRANSPKYLNINY